MSDANRSKVWVGVCADGLAVVAAKNRFPSSVCVTISVFCLPTLSSPLSFSLCVFVYDVKTVVREWTFNEIANWGSTDTDFHLVSGSGSLSLTHSSALSLFPLSILPLSLTISLFVCLSLLQARSLCMSLT